ncbi:uncharacterized protein PGTG_22437 [Puccinia graminis f. sp. tritici CRL 75-36-700-3]|uniref:Uncharacterized protein n=1 Tax=Puccinia graminis f. sp. tritici (strain CRL 75-36-700-3 / race SCCL) TaxID=418459 RepID=H6QUK7_PUCGT|nr:uncharacterized protein PGTG_22437 [Puccinia graminis f. sp. tritici CRL 75-36-700-3]EHS64719.1 hypothetical protein PGTG_22437 [Puccinia graminis f. sp. tritici CRL 75-36-700-3]
MKLTSASFVSEPSSETSNGHPWGRSHTNTVTTSNKERADKEKERTVPPSIQHRISNPSEPELLARIKQPKRISVRTRSDHPNVGNRIATP